METTRISGSYSVIWEEYRSQEVHNATYAKDTTLRSPSEEKKSSLTEPIAFSVDWLSKACDISISLTFLKCIEKVSSSSSVVGRLTNPLLRLFGDSVLFVYDSTKQRRNLLEHTEIRQQRQLKTTERKTRRITRQEGSASSMKKTFAYSCVRKILH